MSTNLDPVYARFVTKGSIGINTSAGWDQIIVDLDAEVSQVAPNLRWVQIKEKFGALCVHTEGGNKASDALIKAAEKRASTTCEECGSPGTLHVNIRRWYRTLCPLCAADKDCRPTAHI